MPQKIIKYALLEAAVATGYVVLVVSIMNNGKHLFGQNNELLTGIAMLLLLVFSAAFMGMAIFGRSIAWYLDGQKKEAMQLVTYKLAFLLVILAIIFLVLILFK